MPSISAEAVRISDFKTSKDYIKKACLKNKNPNIIIIITVPEKKKTVINCLFT